METDLAETLAFLECDLMSHLPLLKFRRLLGDRAELRHFRQGSQNLVVLSHSPLDTVYDRRDYPQAQRIHFVSGDDLDAFAVFLRRLPPGIHIFKGRSDFLDGALPQEFHPVRRNRFLSMTAGKTPKLPAEVTVEVRRRFEPAMAELFRVMEYRGNDVDQLLGEDGTLYFVREDEKPVSACLAFRNHDRIFEIGGLCTLPEYRGRGYGLRLVLRAASDILASQGIPRYYVHASNNPSIRLAEKAGFDQVIEFSHDEVKT